MAPSLGTLLLELLAFYGEVFEPKLHAVLGSYGVLGGGAAPPPGCGLVERTSLGPLLTMERHALMQSQALRPLKPPTPAQLRKRDDPFPMEPLVCCAPVDLANNSAKSCYRIGPLQKLLVAAARAAANA